MKSIRDLITISEGRKVVKQVITTEMLRAKALIVAKKYANEDSFYALHSTQWIDALKSEIEAAKSMHDEIQKEEKEYHDEEGEPYTMKPFDLKANIHDIMYQWWDKTQHTFDIVGDVNADYREWWKNNQTIEQCDQMDIYEDEKRLGWKVSGIGLVDTETMNSVLNELDNLADTLKRCYNRDSLTPTTPATKLLITAGIPLILFYCDIFK